MKLLTLRSGTAFHPAIMLGDNVLDLALAAESIELARQVPATMRDILGGGQAVIDLLGEIAHLAKGERRGPLEQAGALMPLDRAVLGPVVPDPTMFLSIGGNSRGHLAEMGDEPPLTPESFFKVRSAISASGDTIAPPAKYADMLDWEGELCVVIGKRCHGVTPGEAEEYIAGYTLTNDVSARNSLRDFLTAQGRGAVVSSLRVLTQLKNFPGFCPIGPVIATRDEFPAAFDYHMETLVNGDVVQSSRYADLVFTPAQILSYYSEFYIFEPGDIFSLGSPPGVGMAMKPPRYLAAGDVVEVRLNEIGVLRNTIGPPRV